MSASLNQRAAALILGILAALPVRSVRAGEGGEDADAAIRGAVEHLIRMQRADGAWHEAEQQSKTGTTSLVTLALLRAGQPADEPHVARGLEVIGRTSAADLDYTYDVALRTMVLAAADPVRHRDRIEADARWLERAQIAPGDGAKGPGSWAYSAKPDRPGDNSNSHYALLGLHAAGAAGIPIGQPTWALARRHWESAQHRDGGWSYRRDDLKPADAAMTCAGLDSLLIIGSELKAPAAGPEARDPAARQPAVRRGIDWLARNAHPGQNVPNGRRWLYSYRFSLGQLGRFTGREVLGNRDLFREETEAVVRSQRLSAWVDGEGLEHDDLLATSFAILFLRPGQEPPARPGPGRR